MELQVLKLLSSVIWPGELKWLIVSVLRSVKYISGLLFTDVFDRNKVEQSLSRDKV